MRAHPMTIAERHLKTTGHRIQELESLLDCAFDIHLCVSDPATSVRQGDTTYSLLALSEVLIRVIDIVRALHGVYDDVNVENSAEPRGGFQS